MRTSHRRARWAAAVLACGALLPAQDGGSYPAGRAPVLPGNAPVVTKPATNEPWVGDDGRTHAPIPPTDPASLPKTPLPVGFGTVSASTRPSRLRPGGTGTLHVTLRLQPGLVVVPGDFDLGYTPAQGVLQFDGWHHLQEARASVPGLPAAKVYDELLIAAIPCRVAAGAPPGPQRVQLTCAMELHDAGAGQSRGAFAMPVEVDVVIAEPGVAPPEPVREPEPPADALPVTAAEAPPPAPVGPLTPLEPPDHRIDWQLYAGIGALLVLIAMLMRKRR